MDCNRSPHQECRCFLAVLVGEQGVVEEVEDGLALESSRLDDGQDSLDEAAAEGVLAPEHAGAELAFEVVVGRFDALAADEDHPRSGASRAVRSQAESL